MDIANIRMISESDDQPPCIFRNSVGWYQPRLRRISIVMPARSAGVNNSLAERQDEILSQELFEGV